MCWQCDNPHRSTDDYLDILREIIDGHGWAIQYVESENRPFAYTVGLTDLGLPELLMTGLPPRTSGRLLNSIAHDMVDDGTDLRPAMHIDYQDEVFLEVVEVDHPPSGSAAPTSAPCSSSGPTTSSTGRGIVGGATVDVGNRCSVSAPRCRDETRAKRHNNAGYTRLYSCGEDCDFGAG